MHKLAPLLIAAILIVATPAPALARDHSPPKVSHNQAKDQQKAMKKAAKAQQKELKKAHKRANP